MGWGLKCGGVGVQGVEVQVMGLEGLGDGDGGQV